MNIFQWVDDPEPMVKYTEAADKLRRRPGKWARVIIAGTPNAAVSFAANIRRGRVAAFRPAELWEARSEGRDVKVRYIGEASR